EIQKQEKPYRRQTMENISNLVAKPKLSSLAKVFIRNDGREYLNGRYRIAQKIWSAPNLN
ncbi:unnamed protein product, partial [Ilex paraguariensis]